MNKCNSAAPVTQKLDPTKRVNYTAGLVLGVDEFQQEQYYFIERTRRHNRFLHGYGTVSGLRVDTADTGGGGLELRISPGLAVNPKGQDICVADTMCARLDTWLQTYQQALQAIFGAPPFSLGLSVVLCARDCQTDTVPIPGEPCRSQQDSMAASRIADSFELKLCLDMDAPVGSPPMASPQMGSPPLNTGDLPCYRPSQTEEQAVRDFGRLLEQIDIVENASSYLTAASFSDLVRSLLTGIGSPPGSPPISPPGSPPGSLYHLPPDQACDILRAGFLVWVTEVRPQLSGRDIPVACRPPKECCVLLAEIHFPVNASWQIGGAVDIDEMARPYLLDTRLLQELVICAGRTGGTAAVAFAADTFASIFAVASDTMRAWIHHPVILSVPAAAAAMAVSGGIFQPLVAVSQPFAGVNIFDLRMAAAIPTDTPVGVRFNTTQIVNAANPAKTLKSQLDGGGFLYADRQGDSLFAFGSSLRSVTAHGALSGLANDDHPQYLRTDGSRTLGGNWSAGAHRITNLAAATSPGDAVRFEQAVKVGDTAGGDLAGQYAAPTVAGLQGKPVSPAAPGNGDVLLFSAAGQWAPTVAPFVRAPGGLYIIAAAGFFDVNGAPLQPPYNGLDVVRAAPAGTGQYRLQGAWYTVPTAANRIGYVVKGTAQDVGQAVGGAAAPPAQATVQFLSFGPTGIQIVVLGIDGRERNFMIEVSRYGG